jgi:biopolymer transport protein ExbD
MFDLQEDRQPRAHLEGNIIPVINMTFLLLLFFIVAGNFAENLNQEIYPPRSVSDVLTQPAVLELELMQNGTLFWEGEQTSVPAWADALRSQGLALPHKVRLRADGATPAKIFIPVLEDFKFLQISRVTLVTVNNGNVL